MLTNILLKQSLMRSNMFSTSIRTFANMPDFKVKDFQSLRKPEAKNKKFSSFGTDKDYNIEPDQMLGKDMKDIPVFEPKKEFMQMPFDENVRNRMDVIPNHLQYRFMYGNVPQDEAQSQYVAVNKNGKTYHLFNAKRMPIGRIALMVSKFIRGKHKPTFTPLNFEAGDKCIVVNIADPYMTGRKRQQKVYRHHTGYPGGLKEYQFRTVLEKDPERILREAVMGMLPKNSQRKDMVKQNLQMVMGQYHNYGGILPQFTDPLPQDINQTLGVESLRPEDTVIRYSSAGQDNLPEELKGFPVDWDDSVDVPLTIREKTHTQPRANFHMGSAYKRSYKNYRRFKEHRADSRK